MGRRPLRTRSALRFWADLVEGFGEGPSQAEFSFDRPLHPSSPDVVAPQSVQQTIAPWETKACLRSRKAWSPRREGDLAEWG